MALLHRRTRLPDEVRTSVALPRGDRVIAQASLEDGWALASVQALHVVRPERGQVLSRPWSDVDGASLHAETSELTVRWVDGSPPEILALSDDRAADLPRAIHERVQSSVVHRESVALPGGVTVRVVLRRGPDGALLTQVLGPGGVDLSDPETASLVDAAEARVREAAGLS